MNSLTNFSMGVALLSMMLLLPGAAIAQNNGSTENVRTSIEETYREFSSHLRDGNAREIVNNFYTGDARFYPPGGGEASGRDEIQNVLQGFIDAGIHVELEIRDLEVFEDVAYEYGVANVKNASGDRVAQNEYVVLWKKEGDAWKIHRDFIKTDTTQN